MKRKKNGGQFQAILAVLLLIASTTLFFMPILIIGLIKLIPIRNSRIFCTKIIDRVCSYWSAVNNFYVDNLQPARIIIEPVDSVSIDKWYIVIANHQSWLDIVLLQRAFNNKIPTLKFFIKDTLKWVPLLGFAWWAMGSPFMKRYSKAYLSKNPMKQHKDREATQKALALFKEIPSAITNFVEGTRFTATKKEQQQSPYLNLLKPRAGGVSFAVSALGKKLDCILDVTIIYSDKKHSLWDFLCHRMSEITVKVRKIPIPETFTDSQYFNSTRGQEEFRSWLNRHWQNKDDAIQQLKLK